MFVRARRAAPLLAALALLAAGCGSSGGSKPVSLPTVSPSSPASASVSPTAAPANDKAAVEAVVRRYYSLLNAKTSLSQAQQIESITTAKCPCRHPAKAIRDALTKQQHFFGTNKIVHLIPSIDGASLADAIVEYDYTREGVADAKGHVVTSNPGRRGVTERVVLRRKQSAWVISDITQIAPGGAA